VLFVMSRLVWFFCGRLQVKEVMDAMAVDTAKAGLGLGSSGAALKVDGGMTSNEPLMQFQADLLGTWTGCGRPSPRLFGAVV
jgi:glycerol kinase